LVDRQVGVHNVSYDTRVLDALFEVGFVASDQPFRGGLRRDRRSGISRPFGNMSKLVSIPLIIAFLTPFLVACGAAPAKPAQNFDLGCNGTYPIGKNLGSGPEVDYCYGLGPKGDVSHVCITNEFYRDYVSNNIYPSLAPFPRCEVAPSNCLSYIDPADASHASDFFFPVIAGPNRGKTIQLQYLDPIQRPLLPGAEIGYYTKSGDPILVCKGEDGCLSQVIEGELGVTINALPDKCFLELDGEVCGPYDDSGCVATFSRGSDGNLYTIHSREVNPYFIPWGVVELTEEHVRAMEKEDGVIRPWKPPFCFQIPPQLRGSQYIGPCYLRHLEPAIGQDGKTTDEKTYLAQVCSDGGIYPVGFDCNAETGLIPAISDRLRKRHLITEP